MNTKTEQKKRVSFEFFGQMRWWEEQNTHIPFKKFLEDNGYIVDVFGTFWNDEYTNELKSKNLLNFFDKLQLIDEPDFENFTLHKYFYSLNESYKQRVLFQDKFNISYDLCILTRPDVYFCLDKNNTEINKKRLLEIKSVLEKNKYVPTIISFYKDGFVRGNRMEDKTVVGNELAMSIISETYEDLSNSNEKYLPYHSSLGNRMKDKNIQVLHSPDTYPFFTVDLMRHHYQRNHDFDDAVLYNGKFVRNEIKLIQRKSEYVKYITEVINNLSGSIH